MCSTHTTPRSSTGLYPHTCSHRSRHTELHMRRQHRKHQARPSRSHGQALQCHMRSRTIPTAVTNPARYRSQASNTTRKQWTKRPLPQWSPLLHRHHHSILRLGHLIAQVGNSTLFKECGVQCTKPNQRCCMAIPQGEEHLRLFDQRRVSSQYCWRSSTSNLRRTAFDDTG